MAMVLESTPAARRGVSTEVFACAAWLAFAVLSIAQNMLHPANFFLSTDDAMRLAQMRDLMAGQSWFDTTQIRMNTPYGLVMHWPHYVDAALAGLIFMLRPFAGTQAETAAIWLWPLLTALPMFLAVVRIGKKLGGRDAALLSLVLVATCVAALGIFQPGRIDHHNVQIALCLWMAAWLLEDTRPRYFAFAAMAGTFSLAIGLETLPYVLVAALFVTGLCVFDGEHDRRAARAFGMAFAASAAVLFALAPAAERMTPVCDAYSLFYALAAVIGGLGLAMLTFAPRNRMLRLGGVALLAAGVVALSAHINPECFSGPYAQVRPMLDTIWLSRIQEAQPAWKFALQDPVQFIAGYLYALVCFVASCALYALSRRSHRAALPMVLLSACALAVATFEVRGITFAILFGLPGLAALAALLVRRLEKARLPQYISVVLAMAVLLLSSDVVFDQAGKGFGGIANASAAHAGGPVCAQKSALTALNALPAARIAGLVDQGPAILAYTHHAVIAGPYHRGANAILDTNTIFAGSPAQAAQVLATRKVDYILTCPSSPDDVFYRTENSGGLLARLDRADVPVWLASVALPDSQGALRLYRVIRPQH